MQSLYIISLIAGILTILAPCVLPILPVIIWGSLWQSKWYKPLVIIISLAVSVVAFTLLLKFASIFIGVPPQTWTIISWWLLIILWVAMIFPDLRSWIAYKTKIEHSQQFLQKANQQKWIMREILLGAALWPVFSSCSPTYFLILAVVLPSNFAIGLINLIIYSAWLALWLSVIAYGWRAIFQRAKRAWNPNGRFKKILGVIIFLTWLAIITGFEKKIETYLLDQWYLNITQFEQQILDSTMEQEIQVPQNNPLFNANYPAPEFQGLENWINTPWYQSIKDLEGKVVLVDFWTYSCINCIRTLPYLQDRQEKYEKYGLVILWIHAPEFQFEKDINNVTKAVEKYGLTYPVVQDNDFLTRRAYKNRYRPAKYITDKEGNIRYYHFGEGKYEETEQVIIDLLKQIPGNENLTIESANNTKNSKSSYNAAQTAETYLGINRSISSPESTIAYLLNPSDTNIFTKPENTNILHSRRLEWERSRSNEHSKNISTNATIWITTYAKQVNLVMSSDVAQKVNIIVDGSLYKTIDVQSDDLYTLFESEWYEEHTIQIMPTQPWLEAYAFTFG